MIKNERGEIEIRQGSPLEIIIEWMQLTHGVTMAIAQSTGKEITLYELIEIGSEALRKMEADNV